MFFKWDDAGENIYVERDHGIKVDEIDADVTLTSQIVYTKGTKTVMAINTFWKPFHISSKAGEGNNATTGHVILTQDADNTITIKGVRDWWSTDDQPPSWA